MTDFLRCNISFPTLSGAAKMPAARDAKFPICYENITAAPFGGMNAMKTLLLLAVCLFGAAASATAQTSGASAFATRLDDPRAIALTGAVGDGKDRRQCRHPGRHRQGGIRPGGRHRLHSPGPLPPDPHHLCVAGGAGDRLGRQASGLRAGRQHARLFQRRGRHGDLRRLPPRRRRELAPRASRLPRALPAARTACRPIPISPTPIPAPSIRR